RTAHDERPGLHQLHHAFFLAGGQLWSAPPALVIDQAVHAPQQKGLTPLIETGDAEGPSVTEHLHGHLVHQQVEEHGDAPYQPHIIILRGVLQTAVQLFDSRTTALYPEAHGCLLLGGGLAYVLGPKFAAARYTDPQIKDNQ